MAAAATDAEYHAVVADLMGELQDTHAYVGWTYPDIRWTFADLMPVGDLAVIRTVNGTDQIAVGDIVTALDGQTIDEAIAALPPIMRVSSTPWNQRRYALSMLLSVYNDDESLEVTVLGADGESRTVTLTAPDQEMPRSWESPAITVNTLPSGVGVIGVTRLWDNDEEAMIATFDAALESFAGAPGLILDLRGNGGGASLVAGEMAGRFLTEQFDYGKETFRVRLPSRFWLSEGQRTVAPRAPHVDVPLVVLTDELVVSSSEEFVIALVDPDRAQSVGRTTGGGSGNPIRFTLCRGCHGAVLRAICAASTASDWKDRDDAGCAGRVDAGGYPRGPRPR
ncbi:MAG: hypothetical protein IPK19_40600 [Chloroflexi bacterium]|nr:hypothetical protein [Chloroflexota bacterium]